MTIMKHKNILFYIGCFFTLISYSSCDDAGFLKETPEYFYTPDNAFSTSAQVDQVLVGCYFDIRDMYCVPSANNMGYAFKFGNGTDMFDVNASKKNIIFNDYGLITPLHGNFNSCYSFWYQLITKANLALHAAELPQIAWADENDKAYAMAQARFFRALSYRNLGELFGGVPIVTEIATAPRFDYVRSSNLETYQYAIDELEAILNDLPETTNQPGRVVRGAAQHNLCQLYIDKGILLDEEGKAAEAKTAYEKAISYANMLIDGNIYSLMTERFGTRKNENPNYYYADAENEKTPDHLYSAKGVIMEGNAIWDMFQEGNQNYQEGNKEAIWVAQIDYEAFKVEDKYSQIRYSRFCSPIMRDAAGPYLLGVLEDVGGRGVGPITPTEYTRDLIYEGKWNDDMRNSETVFRRTFLGNNSKNEYYGKVIPWDVLYKVNESQDAQDNAYTKVFPISCKIATDKYTGLEDGQDRSNLFRDEYLIRLAETILLRAEAKMRNGDNEGAAADINKLRERAQCAYLVTAADVNLDLILDERARELVYEESRWNTLLRMRGTVAVDRIKKYAYWDEPRLTLNFNFNTWPIPQTVIDMNKDVIMEQNPGWDKK